MGALRFCYVGSLTSNNRVTRRTKQGKILKSASAREDQKKVKALATEAVLSVPSPFWGNACEVEIVAWNTRKDCGNIEKVICDGMTGVAYDDDRRITKLTVEKRKDRGGERYEVCVRPAEPLETPKKKQAAALDDDDDPTEILSRMPAFLRTRRIDDLKSGDTLTFEERDRLLAHYAKVEQEIAADLPRARASRK
jgi:Holliday junction resolvase RusA-like endonuclease